MTEKRKDFECNEQDVCKNNESDHALVDKTESLNEVVSDEEIEEIKEVVGETSSSEVSTPPSSTVEPSNETSCPHIRNTAIIAQRLEGMEYAAVKTSTEMRELHKLYHTEFAGRLKKMQDELDDYHEIGKGRVFDGILAEIAKLYSDNEKLVDTLESKQLKFMFMDLLQMLENNGVHVQKSKIGDKRNTKYCQIIEQIVTDDPELHDTVAESLNTGFYVENRTLVKERIHLNVFKESQPEALNNE